MKIAILSDLHGNLAATESVLAEIDNAQPDRIFCLGDLVGYGPFPNEVTTLIRTQGIPTIVGNYDDGVGFDRDDCGCAYRSAEEESRGQQSLAWTRATTSAENKAFLRSLSPALTVDAHGQRLLLVHGSPRKMNEYLFEDRDPASLARIAQGVEADVLALRAYAQTLAPVDRRRSTSSMQEVLANRRMAIHARPGSC